MERFRNITIIFLLAVGMLGTVAFAKSSGTLLQEGLYAEEVDGDLDAAIEIYQKIIEDGSAQRSHIAQAMYRQGMCYLKKQNEAQAKEVFAKLVANYSDQTKVVNKVKPLLEELGNADPAALMPPETLIYVETGSPGRQIETILDMLKGTPLENPLAVLGGGRSQKSPGDIIATLMNPAMMAEFKKIRGMGVGVTGIAQNNPPVIVVLFPGKSDALRGLILAGLGFLGKPGEPIEGMQRVVFNDGGGAAYDETTVIIASPAAYSAGQLEWSVKQYKGVTRKPTLASSNKSFAKVSKKERQENALTIWANVDEVFEGLKKMIPEEHFPQQIRMANGLVDFENIDDLIVFLKIQKDGIVFEQNMAFKDGNNCIAYDMVRTPNLSKAGFEAVPTEAVGLLSIALGEAGSAQGMAASKKIKNLTGLDIGREIFANIEQINLFVLPPDSSANENSLTMPPVVSDLGLAITSHNPQQTRQILTELLTVANLVTGQKDIGQTGQSTGKYQIGLVNNQKLYCYMNQMNNATVLSLNPDVVETSISDIRRRRSVCTAGPLSEAVNKLTPSTSKLVLVNVGGAIRVADAYLTATSGDSQNPAHEDLAQLSKAFDKTSIQLVTDEQINNLNIRFSIDQLPPLDNVFPVLMQLHQVLPQSKPKAWGSKKEAVIPACIKKASQPVKVDGTEEDIWSEAIEYKLKNVIYKPASSDDDFSASYKSLWDKDNLYVMVNVKDDVLKNDSDEFWFDDTVEVFIDADNNKSAGYGDKGYQYFFEWDQANPHVGESRQGRIDGVEFAFKRTDAGYRVETKFPWATLRVKPSAGTKIGMDVHVNDDDNGGERDTKLTWWGKQDNAWETPSVLGTAELAGLVGWWKLDESEGNTAADSSGMGHTGKLSGGPRWRPSGGKVNGALEFDGIDDYVDTGYTADLSTWTVAVFVKSPAAPSSEGAPSGPVHREKNYNISWNHPTDVFRGAVGVCVDGVWYSAGFGDLQADTWYFLTATYDGENLKAYRDAVLTTDNQEPSGPPVSESESLKFGRHAVTSDYFRGTIDDVRIYNYALSPEKVKALYDEMR